MRRPTALALVSCALLLAGCGEGRSGPPAAGEPVPPYTATTLDGREVSLASLEGDPVVLNFWATWCAPCRRETPFLQSLYEEYGDRGLQVVGVSMDSRGSGREIRDFVERYGVTYRILHDPANRGMDAFSIMGLPATYVLDADGTIRLVRVGPVAESDEEFLRAIREAVSS